MIKKEFFQFSNKVSIIASEKGIEEGINKLHTLGAYRVFIISDKDVQKTGVIQIVKSAFDKNEDICVGKTYYNLEKATSIEDVDKIYIEYRKSGCDSIIAIGGTRAIYAAKALELLLATNSRNLLEYRGIDCAIRQRIIPFAVFPTTFGSGCEVSASAVIIDNERKIPLKFISDIIEPSICILDPRMLGTLSKQEILLNLIDIMTYNVESYVSLNGNEITKSFSKMSLFMIKNNFHDAILDASPESLYNLQRAACLSAIGGSNIFSGLVHAISNSITAKYNIQHNIAVCCVVKACLEFNKDVCEKEYAQMLLFSLGAKEFSTLNNNDRTEAFIRIFDNIINFISTEFKINIRLSEYGIKEEDLESIASEVLTNEELVATPKKPSKEDLINILKECL
jgi:alcohol dehydrogenase